MTAGGEGPSGDPDQYLLGPTTTAPFEITTDAGRTWTKVQAAGLPKATIVRLYAESSTVAWADLRTGAENDDLLYGTTDGGATWTRIEPVPGPYANR